MDIEPKPETNLKKKVGRLIKKTNVTVTDKIALTEESKNYVKTYTVNSITVSFN